MSANNAGTPALARVYARFFKFAVASVAMLL